MLWWLIYCKVATYVIQYVGLADVAKLLLMLRWLICGKIAIYVEEADLFQNSRFVGMADLWQNSRLCWCG